MSNTNPSDLDREALKKAYEAYDKAFPESGFITYEGLRAGIRAYISALPRASGVPEAEAVWQWRYAQGQGSISGDGSWMDGGYPGDPFPYRVETRVLYRASPPPVAAPSGEKRYRHKKRGSTYTIVGMAEVQAADDPLTDFELAIIYRGETDGRLWVRRKSEFEDGRFEELPSDEGEVSAGWEILSTLTPPFPIASEPKDAGSGEASVMEEQAALLAIKAAFQRGHSIARIADNLREEGYRITRTAPSGAKPGEVG